MYMNVVTRDKKALIKITAQEKAFAWLSFLLLRKWQPKAGT
jgi:hypothetical protein